MQGTSSTEPDIVLSRDEDLWLMGYWQEPARRKRRKEQQQKKLWKQECYFQTEVCCSQLSILESEEPRYKVIHINTGNKRRMCASRDLF